MRSSGQLGAIAAKAALAWLILAAGCGGTATLKGFLVLKPGESGDVRGSRVLLYVGPDSTPEVFRETRSEQTSVPSRSPFVFRDLDEGVYRILAWKDVDGDDSITDGDLTGVSGGQYDSAYLGEEVAVLGGQENDAGAVEMRSYRRLRVQSSGRRNDSLTSTGFSYAFNRTVTLRSLTIGFPRFGEYTDPSAPGTKEAGVQYQSVGWSFGSSMPGGQHVLGFEGIWDGRPFSIDVTVEVE
ncbi:MAG: hypothetical protein JSU73_10380 [candidate division WOR-3 bacterium]|nr:MAG: hypothetical protein JSU73_10380 [candidate division WOR-3 bacterium]